MLTPFVRALMYYLGGAYLFALIYANWFFDVPPEGDRPRIERVRRQSLALAAVGLIHPAVALGAVARARDLRRVTDTPTPVAAIAAVSTVASIAGMSTVLSMT